MALRSRIPAIPVVGPGAVAAIERYRRWRSDPVRRLESVLGSLVDVSVVQVGASDGVRQDPIRTLLLRHPAWTALLIEPFGASFDALRANYPDDPRFRFENVAIAATEGEQPFWYLRPEARAEVPGIPGHFDQLGSFFREYLAEELGAHRDRIAPYVTSEMVPTARLPAVLERNSVAAIDLFIVDTNGYDWVVLEQLDLARYRPKVVLFEHKHLSDADRVAALAHLGGRYRVVDLGDDYFCVR